MCNEPTGNDVQTLSFLKEGKWLPERTDDYDADCQRGRAIADEVIELITRTGNPAMFGSVVRAMTEAGVYEGVEIGFCSRLGIYIIVNSPGA